MRALKAGDLAFRMPSAAGAPEGEVAVLFNDIAERLGELWRTNEQLRQHARQLSEQVKGLEQRNRESTNSRVELAEEAETQTSKMASADVGSPDAQSSRIVAGSRAAIQASFAVHSRPGE